MPATGPRPLQSKGLANFQGPIFKKGKKEYSRNYMPVSVALVPGKVMEKTILGVFEKHLKSNKVTGPTSKASWSNLISFYGKAAHLVDQGKLVDIIFLDFSISKPVSHSIYPSRQNVQHSAG